MSHRDDLLCYSRGKLCLLNMFLASSGTLDALFARYGRFLWRNVSSEGEKSAIFEQYRLKSNQISVFAPSELTLCHKNRP